MTTSYTKFKTKSLKKPAVKVEYDALAPEYAVITSIIEHRQKRGWTQLQLAEVIGTRQPVISRLERGEGNPTLQFLKRVADALEIKLEVSMG